MGKPMSRFLCESGQHQKIKRARLKSGLFLFPYPAHQAHSTTCKVLRSQPIFASFQRAAVGCARQHASFNPLKTVVPALSDQSA